MWEIIKSFFGTAPKCRIASNIKAKGDVTIKGIHIRGDGGSTVISSGQVNLSGRSITVEGVTVKVGDDLVEAAAKLTAKGFRDVTIKERKGSLRLSYDCGGTLGQITTR